MTTHFYRLGAHYSPTETTFTVWSPLTDTMDIHLIRTDEYIPMHKDEQGYFSCTIADIKSGDTYLYRIDNEKERPDPASHHQPDGVHGASAVINHDFAWSDTHWNPPTLRNSVFYELHVGTFTPEGTFEAIIPHLPRLKALGITTIELMPIAQFPGRRNWGYDGVQIYAPHHTYGGVDGLKRLVNACHQNGLGVFLDVVYNHLGPEGNYLWDYAPYFTHKYQSPWGASLNFDGGYSDHVRDYFIQNAIYWMRDYHIDGFRLDATHALFDFSARPFLTELTAKIQDWSEAHNKRVYVIAESDKSDRTLHLPREANGVGMNGQWLDDLHHVLHCALTGESEGYYADYADFSLLYKILREGFAYTGQYAPAWNRRHGTPSADISTDHFIVASQNHDQVGNRMLGERLSALTDFDGLKIAAALAVLSPYVPMLFMGEEYGETAPFLYFVSHGDVNLIEGVRKGRAEEFSAFQWKGTPPDPQAESTFLASKLNHDLYQKGTHAILYRLYGYLLKLRHEHPVLTHPHRNSITIYGNTNTESRMVCIERHNTAEAFRVMMNFHPTQAQSLTIPTSGKWQKICDSNAPEWCVDGLSGVVAPDTYQPETAYAPKSFIIYHQVRK